MTVMRASRLLRRSLWYHWRTNLAVMAGVATAVAVLAGSLLVGDSVRGSLRELVDRRLGRTDLAVVSSGFFREQLAADIAGTDGFTGAFEAVAPLIAVPGVVTNQNNGQRAAGVKVYGVDERFWTFHKVPAVAGIGDRDALINAALAAEIGAAQGGAVLVRVQRPSDIPLESLYGRKDETGRTLRLDVRGIVSSEALGDFSLDAHQSDVLAVFVPLSRLQQELEIGQRANTIIVTAKAGVATGQSELAPILRRAAALDDLGLQVRSTADRSAVVIESEAGVLNDGQVALVEGAFGSAGVELRRLFTYLANTIRRGEREVPYSLVSAIEASPGIGVSQNADASTSIVLPSGDTPSIALNQWAASDLGAAVGDTIALDSFVWEDPGRLVERSTDFRLTSIVPIAAGDRDMAPMVRGITDSADVASWDPPFPVDLRRVRPEDEASWDGYRTTPKAFIALDVGQRVWRSRYGAVTSFRVATDANEADTAAARIRTRLREAIDPLATGLAVRDVRAEGRSASRGATDFGEYFVYFSFFLVVSALVLAALFFKLGIEQRGREVGLLRAVGLAPRQVWRIFATEGALLAAVGGAFGVLAAIGYADLLMRALGSWWVDAVGTTDLRLHVSGASLAAGAFGGIAAAMACTAWTLRSLGRASERDLLNGRIAPASAARQRSRSTSLAAAALALTGVALVAGAITGRVNATAGFFGAGSSFLVAWLCAYAVVMGRRSHRPIQGLGVWPVSRLGLRNVTYRPGRSVLSMAVIASATFILIAVGAFRREGAISTADPHTGTGGYELIVESLLPVVHDPNSTAGRDALNLLDLDSSTTIEPFRLLPGDDASCLNLYEPKNPRILAPRPAFTSQARFAFQGSIAQTPEDVQNPWRLLDRVEPDGAVPVIADANSMTYVLHRGIGENLVIERNGRPITLRFVAALRDSIFQSEVLMSEANFQRVFPEVDGYRWLLVDTSSPLERVRSTIENGLTDFGADATATGDRLAAFHRVENTYLATFQTLGGLGLLLGTVGLATVLMRNALERRRELALLEAVGFMKSDMLLMAAAETGVLVGGGLLAGAISAGIAIAPALLERGGGVPVSGSGMLLVGGVFLVGLLAGIAAMVATMRAPLLESLRAE
jgi:ABC-type lipoprotein release transport system permease subunit